MVEPRTPVHVTDDQGQHWLTVADLVNYLNYSSESKASQQRVINENRNNIKPFRDIHVSDKDKHSIDQGVPMINEVGIAHWLMRSRMPVAEKFKGWFAKNAKIYGCRPILQLYEERGASSEQVQGKENPLDESKSGITFKTIIWSTLISILLIIVVLLVIHLYTRSLGSRKDIYASKNNNFVRKMRVG